MGTNWHLKLFSRLGPSSELPFLPTSVFCPSHPLFYVPFLFPPLFLFWLIEMRSCCAALVRFTLKVIPLPEPPKPGLPVCAEFFVFYQSPISFCLSCKPVSSQSWRPCLVHYISFQPGRQTDMGQTICVKTVLFMEWRVPCQLEEGPLKAFQLPSQQACPSRPTPGFARSWHTLAPFWCSETPGLL